MKPCEGIHTASVVHLIILQLENITSVLAQLAASLVPRQSGATPPRRPPDEAHDHDVQLHLVHLAPLVLIRLRMKQFEACGPTHQQDMRLAAEHLVSGCDMAACPPMQHAAHHPPAAWPVRRSGSMSEWRQSCRGPAPESAPPSSAAHCCRRRTCDSRLALRGHAAKQLPTLEKAYDACQLLHRSLLSWARCLHSGRG